MWYIYCVYAFFAMLLMFSGCDDVNPILSVIEYSSDTAAVDYKGANNVVFYDFSSGTKTVVAHDAWHIAFDTSRYMIANSGSYGYEVLVCSTGVTDITHDFSSWKDSLQIDNENGHFRLITTTSNILGHSYIKGSGSNVHWTQNVYLVATRKGGFYKFQIKGHAPAGNGLLIRIDSLSGIAAQENTFLIDTADDYVYIHLGAKSVVSVAPSCNQWDIRFGRTGAFLMKSLWNGRSSIAINKKGAVAVASVENVQLAHVVDALAYPYRTDLLAIGHGWYNYNNADKVYEVLPNVYVVKTTEGHYAKMKMLSFKGPNGESFWSVFKYYYQSNGASHFSK